MANIIGEIDTIGDLLTDVGVTRLYKQDLPKIYVANTIGIRWQGDTSESETGVVYRIDRIYQVVYFGKSEVDCLQKIPTIQTALNQNIKAKLRDSNGYITLGSLVFSAPFKTDTDNVYAVSGVLPVSVRVAREIEAVAPKIGNVTVVVQPTEPDGSTSPDDKYDVITNPDYICGKGEI